MCTVLKAFVSVRYLMQFVHRLEIMSLRLVVDVHCLESVRFVFLSTYVFVSGAVSLCLRLARYVYLSAHMSVCLPVSVWFSGCNVRVCLSHGPGNVILITRLSRGSRVTYVSGPRHPGVTCVSVSRHPGVSPTCTSVSFIITLVLPSCLSLSSPCLSDRRGVAYASVSFISLSV